MAQDEFERLVEKINQNSPLKSKDGSESRCMTVHAMGDLLGLHKTERYWLIKKNYFVTVNFGGTLLVDKESFEDWYANQSKYHKVNGPEPGEELKKHSYSYADIAELLGVSTTTAASIIKRNHLEYFVFEHTHRVSVEAFETWLNSQNHYRTIADQEKDEQLLNASLSVPEAARLLGIDRQKMYQILNNARYKDIFLYVEVSDKKRITKKSLKAYLNARDKDPKRKKQSSNVNQNKELLTKEEAALAAGVTKKTISLWISSGKLEATKMGSIVRIPRKAVEELTLRKEH